MSAKRKFGFDVRDVDYRHLEENTIRNVVFENNTEVTSCPKDFEHPWLIIIECENQPRNMPLFGVKWEEIK